MADSIHIRMFGEFSLYINGECKDAEIGKSPKGIALMRYLILNVNFAVSKAKLIEALWYSEKNANPENALKTLVSRFRVILNSLYPGLGECIASTQGGYRFMLMDGMSVDLYQFLRAANQVSGCNKLDPDARACFQESLNLYSGELASAGEYETWSVSAGVRLHDKYIKLVYSYVALLKKRDGDDEIIQVCRRALDISPFDEQLHYELMQALVRANRPNDAMLQYKHVTNMHFRYLGIEPPETLQTLYKQVIRSSDTLDSSLGDLRDDLLKYNEVHGAYECDYPLFKEIYHLQMRNLTRFGSKIYIAIIMISSMDQQPIEPMQLDDIMNGLGTVLKDHLRKGDTITHYAPAQYALLLPTVNLDSGRSVLERIKRVFYQRFAVSNIIFNYRISPISDNNASASTPYTMQKNKGFKPDMAGHSINVDLNSKEEEACLLRK